ncbi:FadR/GntR family transcriptional regulator [Thalassospira xiamenensis]|uniref:FadR/GntR family transcriptional regulator n=1 Tax=Thalassospira xiamenensis TaxID=220697 RepID=UPI002420111A|nr:FadR/GntR family transcriptional regulator [Thalassospira xiamenensis]MBR9782267.1 FadR family transcriptional regulator [Rhodospirillales bacterium]MBR9816739.1 FadR family transcriptional regulator [Rhodospirillales bacterium]
MLQDMSSHVYARLRDMLDEPVWKNGGRLPPEAELATEFGVSRPVLRKALVRMREEGRIISRRGSGNFVQPRADMTPPMPDLEGLSIQTVFDMKRCMRFRQIIECAAAEDAAKLCDQDKIKNIEAAIQQMLSLQPGQNVFDADFAFHMAIAEASANPYYIYTLGTLRNQIRLTVEFTRKLREQPADELAPRVLQEHTKVYEAIKNGDANTARVLMDKHMKQSVLRLLGHE